tara:strand:- start:122 stop:658 length:537 start_codon:yes stop_codon:yes gene_type:complete
MYKIFTYLIIAILSLNVEAQWKPNSSSNNEIRADVAEAINLFESNSQLEVYFDQAYGYAIFPSIKKAGIGIGGSRGKGQVFEKGNLIGNTVVTQVSVGFQLGAQTFREVIFFKDEQALDRFTRGNFEFGAQASAVVLTEGVAVEVEYSDGVAIFTETNGGLMYEASIGGQKFNFNSIE